MNTYYSQDSIYKKFYFESGNLSSEGYFSKNVTIGKCISYYQNKKIKSVGFWKNAQLDSTWLFYDSTGNLILKENYSKNLKEGFSIEFDTSGYIRKQTQYKRSKVGLEKIFFDNSELIKFTTIYNNGKKHGKTLEYNKNKKIITILNYNKGVLSKKEEINRYDSDGNKQEFGKIFTKTEK